MMNKSDYNQPPFDAPIPGMHMTSELGSFPWQQPSQYSSIEEVIEYYTDRMSSEEFNDQLVDIMEMGVPLTTLANTIQMSGVLEGKHTIDTGMLVMPILIEMMRLVGDSAKVKYNVGLDNKKKNTVRASLLGSLKEKLKNKDKKNNKQDKEDKMIIEEESKGLMSRRNK